VHKTLYGLDISFLRKNKKVLVFWAVELSLGLVEQLVKALGAEGMATLGKEARS